MYRPAHNAALPDIQNNAPPPPTVQQRPGTARRLVGNFEDEIGTALVGIAATRAVGLVFSGDLFGTDSTDPSPPAPPAVAAYPNGPDYTTAAGSSPSYDNDDTEI